MREDGAGGRRSPRAVASAVLALTLAGCSTGLAPSGADSSLLASPSAAPSPGASGVSYTLPPPASPVSTTSPTDTPPPPLLGDPFTILGAPAQHITPGISCSGSIGAADPVAVVDLPTAGGDFQQVLRDYADVSKPRTACALGGSVVQLIDARHVVVDPRTDSGAYAIVDLPEVRYHWFALPSGTNDFLAVSPGLDQIAWRRTGTKDAIHLTSRSGDVVVASLPDSNEGRCGAPTDSNNAGYTRSGSALFVLDEPLPEISLIVVQGRQVVLSDVGTAKAEPATRPLFALWSPISETLYFVQNGSVWQWTPALGLTIFLPGVAWDWASISPDGSHLAYAAPISDPYGDHDTYLIDLAHGGSPVKIGKGHAGQPSFLNDRQLFYLPEGGPRGCTGPSPTPAIYDVATGTSAPSIIEDVRATWPATGTHN